MHERGKKRREGKPYEIGQKKKREKRRKMVKRETEGVEFVKGVVLLQVETDSGT